jgi:hypothetical protein
MGLDPYARLAAPFSYSVFLIFLFEVHWFGHVVSVHELIVLNRVFGLLMSVLAEMRLYVSVALAISIIPPLLVCDKF